MLLHEYQSAHIKNRVVIEWCGISWQLSPCGRLKVNIGATLKDSFDGLKVVIWDKVNHIVMSAIEIVQGILSPLIPELMAICGYL